MKQRPIQKVEKKLSDISANNTQLRITKIYFDIFLIKLVLYFMSHFLLTYFYFPYFYLD